MENTVNTASTADAEPTLEAQERKFGLQFLGSALIGGLGIGLMAKYGARFEGVIATFLACQWALSSGADWLGTKEEIFCRDASPAQLRALAARQHADAFGPLGFEARVANDILSGPAPSARPLALSPPGNTQG